MDNAATLKNDLGFISFAVKNEKVSTHEILEDRFVIIARREPPTYLVLASIRSMTAAGLERKCDIRAYVAKVSRLP